MDNEHEIHVYRRSGNEDVLLAISFRSSKLVYLILLVRLPAHIPLQPPCVQVGLLVFLGRDRQRDLQQLGHDLMISMMGGLHRSFEDEKLLDERRGHQVRVGLLVSGFDIHEGYDPFRYVDRKYIADRLIGLDCSGPIGRQLDKLLALLFSFALHRHW